jgi:dCMP deaminase
MSIAKLTASRSPCLSRQVGCVITINNHIVATGYNGPPSGIKHCKDVCPRKQQGYLSGTHIEKCTAIHGEQNAILSCASIGIKIENAVLYCTHFPCSICMKMILNLDIHTIWYEEPYPDELSLILLKEKNFKYINDDIYHRYTRL